jgi:hypothetical protein
MVMKSAFLISGFFPLWLVTCSAFLTTSVGAKGASFNRLTSKLHANVAIFGGTGKTGSECVYQCTKTGSTPFVLARDISKLKVPMGSGGSLGGTSFYNPNIKV